MRRFDSKRLAERNTGDAVDFEPHRRESQQHACRMTRQRCSLLRDNDNPNTLSPLSILHFLY
jgi:hypothetical protein